MVARPLRAVVLAGSLAVAWHGSVRAAPGDPLPAWEQRMTTGLEAMSQGDLVTANAELQDALKAARQESDAADPGRLSPREIALSLVYSELRTLQAWTGSKENAIRFGRLALKARSRIPDHESPEFQTLYFGLLDVYRQYGAWDEEQKALDRLVSLLTAKDPAHPLLPRVLERKADRMAETFRSGEVPAILQQLLSTVAASPHPRPGELARIERKLGAFALADSRYTDALGHWDRAIAQLKTEGRTDDLRILALLDLRGAALSLVGDLEGARKDFDTSHRMRRAGSMVMEDPQVVTELWSYLALALRKHPTPVSVPIVLRALDGVPYLDEPTRMSIAGDCLCLIERYRTDGLAEAATLVAERTPKAQPVPEGAELVAENEYAQTWKLKDGTFVARHLPHRAGKLCTAAY